MRLEVHGMHQEPAAWRSTLRSSASQAGRQAAKAGRGSPAAACPRVDHSRRLRPQAAVLIRRLSYGPRCEKAGG
jgi:hypothetical protein